MVTRAFSGRCMSVEHAVRSEMASFDCLGILRARWSICASELASFDCLGTWRARWMLCARMASSLRTEQCLPANATAITTSE